MLRDYFQVQLRQSVSLAVPLEAVTEVAAVNLAEICPMPGVKAALLGVVNHRGRLLWVLELGDLLGLPGSGTRRSWERAALLVLAAGDRDPITAQATVQLGCVVERLSGIVTLEDNQLQPLEGFSPPLPSPEPRSGSQFYSHIAEVDQCSIVILNVSTLFAALQTPLPSLLKL